MSIDPGKYSLEEILRAKRQDKPGPEFWSSFEREFKSRQRRLIQKQIVDESRLKSPFALRFYRVGSGITAVGFAAFAVVIALRSPETPAPSPMGMETPAASPSFVVKHAESAPVKTSPSGLQEFATVAEVARPRLVVESLPVERPETRRAEPVVASVSAPMPRQLRSFASHHMDASNHFGSFAAEPEEDLDGFAHVSSFEQTYLLGKYADPLSDSFDRSRAPTIESGRLANPNRPQLDEILSSRGGRNSHRTLDTLSLRF